VYCDYVTSLKIADTGSSERLS